MNGKTVVLNDNTIFIDDVTKAMFVILITSVLNPSILIPADHGKNRCRWLNIKNNNMSEVYDNVQEAIHKKLTLSYDVYVYTEVEDYVKALADFLDVDNGMGE